MILRLHPKSFNLGMMPTAGYWRYLNPGPFNIKGTPPFPLFSLHSSDIVVRTYRDRHHGLNCVHCGCGYGDHRRPR